MKKLQLFMGFYLAMQSLTCMLLVGLFLMKGKKNSAGVFMTAGFVSGVCGALMIYKQVKEKLEDKRLSAIISELLSDEDADDEDLSEIPLDESASELEFQA